TKGCLIANFATVPWEQRQALAKLRQQGREQVDESALFRMIGQMRATGPSHPDMDLDARTDVRFRVLGVLR
ncbi:TPA: hypothetical protein ACWSKH_004914, partial [Escherichia coli]